MVKAVSYTHLLAWVATNAANLFDNCFKLVDFTKWGPVENFIKAWKPVFVSLVSLSLLFLGIVLIFWHEKKPKFVMNLCLAVLIVSSSGYLIQQLNGFLADDMRSAIAVSYTHLMHMGSPTRMNPIEILLIATATATKRDSNQKMA